MGREQSRVNKKERKKGREGEEMKKRSWGQSANNEKMGKEGRGTECRWNLHKSGEFSCICLVFVLTLLKFFQISANRKIN